MNDENIDNNEMVDDETPSETKLDKIKRYKNNIIIGLIMLLALVNIILNQNTDIESIITALLALSLIQLQNKKLEIEHEPAEIFNDVANSFSGEQFGIKDIRNMDTYNLELGRPKIRIQTISQDFILFLFKDKTYKPIGMLCKKKYKQGTVPLLDLYSSDIVEMDVPEIIRLSERDLYGQKNRELKIAQDLAKKSYLKYRKEESE